MIGSESDQALAYLAREKFKNYVLAMSPQYDMNWHHRLLADTLDKVERGEIKRLIVTMPPRHGKSELCSKFFPTYFLGKNPNKSIIHVSYAAAVVERWGGEIRDILLDPRHKICFPKCEVGWQRSRSFIELAQGQRRTGYYVNAGIGGAITSFGADLLIIDDPIKDAEEADSDIMREKVWDFYGAVALTRLEQGGAIVLIQTRWHEDDLAGRLLEQATMGGDQWDVLNFPAIAMDDEEYRKKGEPLWPAKKSLTDLSAIKASVRPRTWWALYQQTPTRTEDQEFKPEWFRYYEHMAEVPEGAVITLAIDPAFSANKSSDYTAITVRARLGSKRWVLDYVNAKLGETPKAIWEAALPLIQTYRPYKIGIEAFAAQVMLGAYFREKLAERGINTEVVDLRIPNIKNANVAKSRIRALSSPLREGNYFFQRWMMALEKQLLAFPSGKNDDLIDSLSFHEYFNLDFTDWNQKAYEAANYSPENQLTIKYDPLTGEPIY